jgi:hypothetical protein
MEYGYDQIKKFDAAFKAKVALEALRGSDGAGEARSYTPRGSVGLRLREKSGSHLIVSPAGLQSG